MCSDEIRQEGRVSRLGEVMRRYEPKGEGRVVKLVRCCKGEVKGFEDASASCSRLTASPCRRASKGERDMRDYEKICARLCIWIGPEEVSALLRQSSISIYCFVNAH